MTTHCKLGDKQAIVSYRLGNSENKVVVIKNVPIEVITSQRSTGSTENFSKTGFGIRFYSPNNRIWAEFTVHDYQIYSLQDYDYGPNYEGIAVWQCGRSGFDYNSDGSLNGPGIDITTLSIIPNLRCPVPLNYEPERICSIEVKYNNSTVFSDSGNCPIKYSVTCGEECPPGTLKCPTTNYPGYCCLPCEPIASSIKAIKNTVQSLNKSEVSRG